MRKHSLNYVIALKECQAAEKTRQLLIHDTSQEFWRQFDLYKFKQQIVGTSSSEDAMLVQLLEQQMNDTCGDGSCFTCKHAMKPCGIHERQ